MSRSNKFQMKRAVSPKSIDQSDRLLSLDLPRDMLDGVLNVKHNCEDLYICSTNKLVSTLRSDVEWTDVI
jgi:hypothetical protein